MISDVPYCGTGAVLDWAIIRLTGKDSASFIHNQSTNDVRKLNNYSFQWNSLLDLSGKIVSYFLLLKESESTIYLLLPRDLVTITHERLDKYLIAEDVEFEEVKKKISVLVGGKLPSSDGFSGILLNDPAFITFKKVEISDKPSENYFMDYWFLQGAPGDNIRQYVGKLINNTFLEELAVNYKKGCFLGQETVAKIHTRRGAAYKTVLIQLQLNDDFPTVEDIKHSDVLVNSKKIGKLIGANTIDNVTYLMVEINRENRLDKKKLNFKIEDKSYCGIIHYLPFYKMTSHEKAISLYDDAIIDFQNDQEDSAVIKLNKAIELDPLFEDAYESLGVIYGRHEKFDQAIELMQKLSEINPSSVMAHTNMSLYYMRLGNIEKAEEEKSIATVKSFEKFGKEAEEKKIQQALEEKQKNEELEREKMFQQVLEIDREDALANYGMGGIELGRQNYVQAIRHLEIAIKTDPKYSVAYLALSKAFKNSEQLLKAKDTLTKGIEVATSNGDLMPANEMQQILQSLK